MRGIPDNFSGTATVPNFVAKLITVNGECIPVTPRDGQHFSYEELTNFVGGDIEIAYPPSTTGAAIVCNEEGKILGLPLNKLATEVWQEHAEPGSPRMSDPIVGNILLCHHTQLE